MVPITRQQARDADSLRPFSNLKKAEPLLPRPSIRRPRSIPLRAILDRPLTLAITAPATTLPLLLPPRTTASEQNNEHAQEQANHSRQASPHADAVVRHTPAPVTIDVVLDDAEERKVNGHDDEGDDPREGRDDGAEEGADHAGTAGEEEGDESDSACDRMQDHGVGEAVGCGGGGFAEALAVDRGHYRGRLIANLTRGAVVLVGTSRSNIEHAVAECAKGN